MWPFSVSSPAMMRSSPERLVSLCLEEELREALGVEEVGALQMGSRFGSLTWTLPTSAVPRSAPSLRRASKSENVPWKVPAM